MGAKVHQQGETTPRLISIRSQLTQWSSPLRSSPSSVLGHHVAVLNWPIRNDPVRHILYLIFDLCLINLRLSIILIYDISVDNSSGKSLDVNLL